MKCKSSLTSVQTRTFQTLLNIASVRFTGIFLHSYVLTLLAIPQTHTTHQTCYAPVMCIKRSVIQSVLCYWYSVLCTNMDIQITYRSTRGNQRLQPISGSNHRSSSILVTVTGHVWRIRFVFFRPLGLVGHYHSSYIPIWSVIYTHTHTHNTLWVYSSIGGFWYCDEHSFQQMIPWRKRVLRISLCMPVIQNGIHKNSNWATSISQFRNQKLICSQHNTVYQSAQWG